MNYTDELDKQLNYTIKEVIKKLVKETGIHPLDSDYLNLIRAKVAACAVELWTDMGKPATAGSIGYIDDEALERIGNEQCH